MPCRSCASVLLFFVSTVLAPLAAQDAAPAPPADMATGAMVVQAIDRLGVTLIFLPVESYLPDSSTGDVISRGAYWKTPLPPTC